MPAQYPFKEIEAKWQKIWEEINLFRAPEPPQKKFTVIPMFAYPSGDIHMGHFRNYTITDAIARFKRMQGYDVLHPFGWDAFGLPAENAAIKRGIHPREWTLNNVAVSKATLKRVGILFDWEREVTTCLPDYYKWTQWLFLKLWEKGLAYRAEAPVNWCPSCQTVLANEQVEQGRCWKCDSVVVKKELTQWFFKITAYAERLLKDIEALTGWPENVKTLQKNWIGKSTGCFIDFPLEGSDLKLPVFTTRPDTVYGVTFLSIAPDSRLFKKIEIAGPRKKEVAAYVEKAGARTEIERAAASEEKDGVFTGRFVRNPLSGEQVPLWVADYVLAGYGSGVVMGVPAHDQRDFEFARKYRLPVKVVIVPPEAGAGEKLPEAERMEAAFTDYGRMTNSGPFDGKVGREAIKAVIDHVEKQGWGKGAVQYKLRDWLISRQRYWGCPIPIIHCPDHGEVAVPEKDLPVLLPPEVKDYIPKGRSPLADLPEFVNTVCPKCGKPAQRDVDTMDTFIDSSWYFLRYADPHNTREPFDRKKANTWLPIDLYVGGIEHATGHLIYFRFFTKVLYDLGYLGFEEPAARLFNHGMVLDAGGQVMSKSLGNVVTPDEVMTKEGADVSRLTMYFAAPSNREMFWSTEGVVGISRFLTRLWKLIEGRGKIDSAAVFQLVAASQINGADLKLYRKLHQTIKKVTEDFETLQFNTAIAALMELLNEIPAQKPERSRVYDLTLIRIAQLLAPLAPHIAEEFWQILGFSGSIFRSQWPEHDPAALVEEELTIAVQVNGRLRATVNVPVTADEGFITGQAQQHDRVKPHLKDKKVLKTVYVPRKLVNIVVQ